MTWHVDKCAIGKCCQFKKSLDSCLFICHSSTFCKDELLLSELQCTLKSIDEYYKMSWKATVTNYPIMVILAI
jgi:hypothetical protein